MGREVMKSAAPFHAPGPCRRYCAGTTAGGSVTESQGESVRGAGPGRGADQRLPAVKSFQASHGAENGADSGRHPMSSNGTILSPLAETRTTMFYALQLEYMPPQADPCSRTTMQ